MNIFYRSLVSVILMQGASLSGQPIYTLHDTTGDKFNIKVINPTFLGNETRNYYGDKAPSGLKIKWKHYLGQGETIISRKLGSRIWAGAGWTGQPLLVEENQKLYLIQGAYDHHLKKIDAETGKIIWQYKFDDVIKGTGTIWLNKTGKSEKEKLIILQGSRLGVGNYLDSEIIPSYRAISYFTGEELWRLNVKWTDSYSRDVDGSALVLNDTVYLGLENSLFTVFSPDPVKATLTNNMLQPPIYQEIKLYTMDDVLGHKNNVVTESSPCLLNNKIYIASGSGHIFGYDLTKKDIVWDFYIGSDIDGSAIVTSDSCLLVSVEKQYIKGNGGVFKLDPSKDPKDAVIWYTPVENKKFSGWDGGVIGSVGINDNYGPENYLAAFTAIDGYLYVVRHKEINKNVFVKGPDSLSVFHTAKAVFKKYVGTSISTPIFVNNKLIVASYNGLYLFQFNNELVFELLDKFDAPFEATPVVHGNKIYIASRDGFLYCFGDDW